MKRISTIILMSFITFLTITTNAQDRHFAWTYESTTLPKGAIDIEPWVTFSAGGENFYNSYENRIEFETGLTDRLQTAVYLNTGQKSFALTDADGEITGLGKSSSFSFSNEWKLNILNPSVSPVGLGLYAEYGLSTDEIELEFKLLLDKKTARSIFSYNFVTELEFESEFEEEGGEGEIETEKEFIIENDLAYMYMIKPTLGIGLEARNHNEFSEGEMEHAVLFFGPTLFFSHNRFFAIVNALPQLTNLKGSGLELDDHQKFSGRILLGFSL